MKTKHKRIIKICSAVAVFLLIFTILSGALVCPNDYRLYQWVGAFYENEPNTLDAVYIGSSTVYAFWCPSIAWKNYGISVWNYTSPDQPLVAAKYIIEDCRKTQKDALYIVNINRVTTSQVNTTSAHFLLDHMPFSLNKHRLISELCDRMDIPLGERAEFYFPFELYHSRWGELTVNDFSRKPDGYMSSSKYGSLLKRIYGKPKEELTLVEDRLALPNYQLKALNSLLDYCEENDVNVLFTVNPQILGEVERQSRINYAKDLITERGFKVLDYYHDEFDSVGLDTTQDFQDGHHTNIHGSIKMTCALSSYLVKNYGLEDKRGQVGYEDWDNSVKKYTKLISAYTLPFEYDNEERDEKLEAVHITQSEYDGIWVNLKWNPSENADGYKIYRRTENKKGELSAYEEIDELDSTETKFLDFVLYEKDDASSFTYIVVPVTSKDKKTVYGRFDYAGTTVSVEDE